MYGYYFVWKSFQLCTYLQGSFFLNIDIHIFINVHDFMNYVDFWSGPEFQPSLKMFLWKTREIARVPREM